MACLVKDRAGNYSVKFRHASKQYFRAVGTKDPAVAELARVKVEETLGRLKRGWLTLPEGADVGAFVLSGGERTQTVGSPREGALTIRGLRERYAAVPKRSNTLATILLHLKNCGRLIGENRPVVEITLKDARDYCTTRGKQKHHNRIIRPYTIRKELRSLLDCWRWAVAEGLVSKPPDWDLRSLRLPPDPGREPFRTFDEIETRIARGGLSDQEQQDLWECLYLRPEEVASVLDHIAAQNCAPFVLPMVATAALAGARRAEILRSLRDDMDLDRRMGTIRELKRDTSREFTTRQVDLHPRLVEIYRAWFSVHPGGRWLICNPDKSPVTRDQATDHLNRVLAKHPKWTKIPGFHTFRHSFASILAARGTDQRIIDSLMGHQTEEMKRRYQHIFPPKKRRAVDDLLIGGE